MSSRRLLPTRATRAACALLILLSCACSSSTLHTRPVWAGGQTPDAPGEGSTEFDARYPAHVYMTAIGEGQAGPGQLAKARDDALKRAMATLTESLWVDIQSDLAVVIVEEAVDDEVTFRREFEEDIRSRSSAVLSGVVVQTSWEGQGDGRSVVVLRVTLDKQASAANMADLVRQEIASIERGLDEVDAAVRRGELAGIPERLAGLTLACEAVRQRRLALSVLDRPLPRYGDLGQSFDSLYARTDSHGRSILAPLTPRVLGQPVFVRGHGDGELSVELDLAVEGRRMALSSCPVRYRLPGSGGTRRARADAQGRLALTIPVSGRTALGEGQLAMSYDFCAEHLVADRGCASCALQVDYSWPPLRYRVVHDDEAFQARLQEARTAEREDRHRDALRAYEAAEALVFDAEALRQPLRAPMRLLSARTRTEDAAALLPGRPHEALGLLMTADQQARGLGVDGNTLRDEIQTHAQQAGKLYASAQLDGGTDASRRTALETLLQVEQTWEGDYSSERRQIRQQLPCEECGRSGRCQTCRGDGEIESTCNTCAGEGVVPDDCPACDEGLSDCGNCADGKLDWETCGQCDGSTFQRCKKCKGDGKTKKGKDCKTCDGTGQTACGKCARCKHGKQFTRCKQCSGNPGFVRPACKVCEGQATVAHDACRPGPKVDAQGNTWRGYQLRDCPTCERSTTTRTRCPERCDDGVCTTCEGAKHFTGPVVRR